MMRVKVEVVREGQHPNERIVVLTSADGRKEQLIVDKRSIQENTLSVGYPVGTDKNLLLIELPRETMSGLWRVWVPQESVVSASSVREAAR